MRSLRLPVPTSVALLAILLSFASRVAAGEGEPGGATPTPAPPIAAPASPAADRLERTCELGITYALSGQAASAESAFVSLLAQSPGDARAINNLGNLSLWRGDAALALAFYARAGQTDTTDAGIVLNEAAALMIAGDDSSARERAAAGIQRAGGPEQAARLLGLKYESPDSEANRSADRTQVTRDEVLALLQTATKSVPVDSTAARGGKGGAAAKGIKPSPAWRSAGARGAAGTDVATVVYWKH